jgi:hypothetical protein
MWMLIQRAIAGMRRAIHLRRHPEKPVAAPPPLR